MRCWVSVLGLVGSVITHTRTGHRHVILPRNARRHALGTTGRVLASRITSLVLLNGPRRVGTTTTG